MPKFSLNKFGKNFFLYFILYSENIFLFGFTAFAFIFRRTSHFVPYSLKTVEVLMVFNLFLALQMLTVCTDVGVKNLKTRGVYAVCRHPFLLFRMCSQMSLLFLISNNIARYGLFIFYLSLTLVRINRHERSLARRYKEEWSEYCRNTLKIIPLPLSPKRLVSFEFKFQPEKLTSVVKFWCYVTFILATVSCFRFI